MGDVRHQSGLRRFVSVQVWAPVASEGRGQGGGHCRDHSEWMEWRVLLDAEIMAGSVQIRLYGEEADAESCLVVRL